MNFDEVVRSAKSKSEMHKWIDELPEGGHALLLVSEPGAGVAVRGLNCRTPQQASFTLTEATMLVHENQRPKHRG